MVGTLTVAVAQPESVPGDIAANALQHARAVTSVDARLVVFPELSLTGYERDAGRVDHISMIRIDGDIWQVVYRKQTLGGREPRRFAAGPGPVAIELDGWRVGLGICKDTGSAIHIAETARLEIDLHVAGLVHRPDELAEQDARGTLGTSAIWSPDGVRLARTSDQHGDVVTAELPPCEGEPGPHGEGESSSTAPLDA